HKDAFKKLKSWRWQIISKGIYELAQMQVAESYGFIKRFINDKRGTIRKQAEIAIISLNTEGLNYFLDTTEYRISEWQQLKLLDVIRNQDDFQPPRFKAWLVSSNKHVVLFALRLIKYYNQNDAFASITELVKHRNEHIKKEAINCIKEFHVVEALPTMKTVFWKSSIDIKIAILDAMAELGTTKDLEFLRSIDTKESNFSVRSKAHGSINAIAPESVIPTRGIMHLKGNQIPKDIVFKDLDDKEHQIEQDVEEVIEEPDTHVVLKQVDAIAEKEQSPLSEDSETTFGVEENVAPLEVENEEEEETVEAYEAPSEIDMSEDFTNISEPLGQVPEEEIDIPFEIGDLGESDTEPLKETTPVLNLGFLPIVVNAEETHDSMDGANDTLPNIEDYVDDFSENTMYEAYEHAAPTSGDRTVIPEEKEEMEVGIGDDPDTIARSFLPHVVANSNVGEAEDLLKEQPNVHNEQPSNVPEAIPSIEESIRDFDLNGENTPFFDFLPLVTESEEEGAADSVPMEESMENDIHMTEENHEAIKSETPKTEQKETGKDSIEWPVEDDIPFSSSLRFVSFDAEADINEATKPISQETLDILSSLPEPKYYDAETMITMRLLDDIEELGDQREIPLLEELFSKSNHKAIKHRIEQIMQQFRISEPKHFSKDTMASPKNDFKPFSVFEDLFRTCDDEAKLILMDEVVAVGDEKELHFLKRLTNDPNMEIREKAAEVLEALDNRLFQENLTFDLSETFEAPNTKSQTGSNRNSLLNQLLAFPNKMIDRING
ncbi:MAG: HEAT repeat domain-containing protein, partial [Maribacter sp.]|uniref:HEAT repeat domain-containing protein n=1 Tax=Maribacter sp. TaxID=1897614 RepID=UPI003C73BF06